MSWYHTTYIIQLPTTSQWVAYFRFKILIYMWPYFILWNYAFVFKDQFKNSSFRSLNELNFGLGSVKSFDTLHWFILYKKKKGLMGKPIEMFYLNSTFYFGIPPVLVFQLEVYYKQGLVKGEKFPTPSTDSTLI